VRILLISENFDPRRGGAERSLLEMGLALTGLGHRVEVLANRSPLRHDWLHVLDGPSVSRRRGLLRFAERARAFVQGADYDVVHSITPALGGDVYQPRAGCLPALFQAAIERPRTGLARAGRRLALRFNAKRQALLNLERRIIQAGQALVCPVSRASAKTYETFYGLSPDKMEVVFNAVDLKPPRPEERAAWRAEQRRLWGLSDRERVLLFIGHDFERKGLEVVIEALNLAGQRGREAWRLMVVGRDQGGPYFRQAARQGVSRRIRWLDDVTSPVSPMLGADLLALPTFFDPCSRVVLEALILGLPAATTPQNGASEVVDHGRSGFVLNGPRHVEGLVEAMTALEDPGRAAEISRAASAKADWLRPERMAAELTRIYERLPGRRSRA